MDKRRAGMTAAVGILLMSGMGLLASQWAPSVPQRSACPVVSGDDPCVPGSCTIFAVRRGEKVFFGNNEDWSDPKTIYWAEPGGSGTYGAVYLGFNRYNPQGGINEKGLAFDYNAMPRSTLKAHPELPPRPGPFANIMMQQAATVEEAINLFRRYNWGTGLAWQMLVADARGDAVVVSAGADGELAFTRKPPGDGFLVSTNFNRAHPDNRLGGYPCSRYEKATEMLGRIAAESDLTVEALRSIVDAVHVEGPGITTLYSNIMDLGQGTIHLYYQHQYSEVVTLHVAAEIAKASKPTPLRDLFSRQTVELAEKERRKYGGKSH